uniref:Uncharacterized protein n=1 Tax=Romanomermis culicivorax TaxID=13658 RepID=A0A915KS62_ROMCU
MDKLIKQLENLKHLFTLAKKKDAATSKEKSQICSTICELVHNNDVKLHQNYPFVFGQVFEALFSLCDDPIADVRIVADESINTIIRNCCLEGSLTRVHVELYKEIKRNGPARSIRSAFTKFAVLVCQIKPQKCRIFATNLTPCLLTLIQRPEESISACLEKEGTKIFRHLGRFFNDEELRSLIEKILPNLQLSSAQARRCASNFLIDICNFCRKRMFFVVYLLKRLIKSMIPVYANENYHQMVGIFNVLRMLIPILKEFDGINESKFNESLDIRDDHLIKVKYFKIS